MPGSLGPIGINPVTEAIDGGFVYCISQYCTVVCYSVASGLSDGPFQLRATSSLY